jgi:SAM-dependent methyltransferase
VTAYSKFAAFYDQIMGDRTVDIDRVKRFVARYHPAARTLLELGCGTGAILAGMTPGLIVAGIDISPEMLAAAARCAPTARLVRADITTFSLGARFDVVICMFDTINHLPSLKEWRAMFDRVHEHLAAGGLFVFDINTAGRLRRLWHGPAFATDFGDHTVIMDVMPGGRGDGGEGELSLWTVRIFERITGDEFRLHSETIPELGLPLATIREALTADFDLLEATGLDGEQATDDSDRVFFVLRHRC